MRSAVGGAAGAVCPDLLDTLRQREVAPPPARGSRLRRAFQPATVVDGEHVAGIYRQRVDLASGRFAMIVDGLGFRIVPWTPTLERHLGH
jgi:hypothetical protein